MIADQPGQSISIRVLPSGLDVAGRRDTTILDACISAGLPVPYNCRSGECGACMATLLAGEVEELPGADPAIFTAAHREEGNILACMCYPRSEVLLNVPMQEDASVIRPETFHVVVDTIERLTPTIYRVRVETPWPVEYRAGQCFEWVVDGVSPNRTYSAANPPGDAHIDFHVRVYPGGKIGAYVSGLSAGAALRLVGPFGNFGLSTDLWRPALCVAGGTGLAPVLAALQSSVAAGERRSVRLLYGARNASELYCLDMLSELRRANPAFEFIPVLSEEPESSAWSGRRGLVSEILERELADVFGYEAYVCGPPAMIDSVVSILERAGIAREDIRTDRFAQAKSS